MALPDLLQSEQLLYVMWSRTTRQTKVGISNAPHARASQIRKALKDDSVACMAAWFVETRVAWFQAEAMECAVHMMLRPLESRPSRRRQRRHYGEWFDMRWPAALAAIELLAQLFAPLGIYMRRAAE